MNDNVRHALGSAKIALGLVLVGLVLHMMCAALSLDIDAQVESITGRNVDRTIELQTR